MIEFPDPLDEDFPLGDGTAAVEAELTCPYCGAINVVALDPGGGPHQEYIEDCQVCCQPWRVVLRYGEDGTAVIEAEPS